VCGDVGCRVPFDAADVRRCRYGRPSAREVARHESIFGSDGSLEHGLGVGLLSIGGMVFEWDDIVVVQEDPEDFFGDADDLFAPDAIGSRLLHFEDEVQWLGIFLGLRVAEIGKDCLGSLFNVDWGSSCEMRD
jgi:hypothetical protein